MPRVGASPVEPWFLHSAQDFESQIEKPANHTFRESLAPARREAMTRLPLCWGALGTHWSPPPHSSRPRTSASARRLARTRCALAGHWEAIRTPGSHSVERFCGLTHRSWALAGRSAGGCSTGNRGVSSWCPWSRARAGWELCRAPSSKLLNSCRDTVVASRPRNTPNLGWVPASSSLDAPRLHAARSPLSKERDTGNPRGDG